MKRRGTSRRQVLDLDTNSSSPKRSWQTKYQQICMDHKNSDTKALPAQNHSENLERKLPQLVGYTSDSEGEEGKKPQEGDLDSKVEDFLKEISDIVPAENPSDQENLPVLTIVEKEENPKASTKTLLKNAKSKSKPLFGPLPMLAVQSVPDSIQEENSAQPTIAWQECYDESSGCYYYWNTETNEVTWEMPQDLRAYQVALEQWNAQQLLLAQRASGGLVPMYMNQSQSVPTSQQVQKKQSKSQEKTKNKRTKSNSDSEDDKIELITSYGPTSEDEDSDNAPDSAPVSATVSASVPVHSMKKKKLEIPKSKAKKEYKEEMAIGPQLPPDYVIPIDMKDKVSASPKMQGNFQTSESSHVICEQPKKKLKAADVNTSEKELQPILTSPQLMKEKDSDEMLIINTQPDSEQISTLQRLKALKNKGSEVSSSESDQSDNEVKTNEEIEEHDENVEEDDDIEDSILERLKNQAKILQELGGEIPEEIKELLKPSPEPIEETSSSPANKQEHQETDSSAIEAVVVNDVAENSEVNEANKLPKTEEIEVSAVPEFTENIEGQTMIEETEQIYENHSESNGLKLIENETKLEDIIPQEKAPTSFSLIAGYGNEDDSEIEEDNKADENVNKSDKPSPLFPIVNNEKEKPSITKSANLKVIKLSAKAKELIHSSTTTGRARATDFVSTSDGLRPAESVPKEPVALSSSNNYTEDFVEPIKKVSRKKRLEVPVIKHEKPYKISETLSKENTIHESKEVASKVAVEKSEVAVEYRPIPYTSTWAYNSELKGGEHRGFGFEYNLDQKLPAGKKGMIQFIKADTLMPKNEPVASLQDKKQIIEEIKQEDNTTKEQATDLAQVVSEKVKFLSEGKEAVPPVQVMAIQLETLTTALGAGGLSVKYLWEWLTSLAGQLASLEQAAAPLGWLCHWDRSYKRYYYRNEETGAIQWEYPNETPTHGGEEAMELCDSPPPPSTPTALQPLPMAPPPPRISSRSPSPDLVTMTDETPPPPLPPLPPPPPIISEQPPLPPLPPSDSPPPLPPSPPPPPPPPIISTSLLSGEPLPPGVDLPEEMFDSSQPPLPVAPPPPAKSPPPPPPPPDITESAEPIYNMGYDVTAVPMHYDPYQVAPDYAGSMYQADATYSSGENYVIARPPANNPAPGTESMAIELDSFYSEVAALDPPPPPPAPSPSPPPPPSPPAQVQPAEPMKKKKKTKLTPGLALKKKGVPSLVAKWQQVQQDVRRESASEET